MNTPGNSNSGTNFFCTRCGTPTPAGATLCPNCGAPLPLVSVSPETTFPAPSRAFRYAGFWLRFVALVVDAIIISLVTTPLTLHMMGFWRPWHPMGFGWPFFGLRRLWLYSIVIKWLYSALLESSSYQATPGKMLLHLRVTDLEGNRISFGRASTRFFGKILSSLTLGIGYMMAGFTQRKQALHDMIADTLVVRD